MPDYGHELMFGSSLTSASSSPERPVALAVASEAAGLELVTFQDHPYQPSLIDAWTLLAFVAARTRHVILAPNVLCLPLRPAAVTARAAASLDLLSEGRLAMGLGAGASWDDITSLGAPLLAPAQRVNALQEAITVMRGLWNTSDSGLLTTRGRHHYVEDAARGPRPAHDIPLWIAAYKPRMLRLTGQTADGWLPSAGFLKQADMASSQSIIDEAAETAGRDPRRIRRLLTVRPGHFPGGLRGTPADWPEQLLPLVREMGFSTFILHCDHSGMLHAFGQEVAPALREAVAAERTPPVVPADTSSGSGFRRAAAPAVVNADGRCRLDALPARLASVAVRPGDPEYRGLRHSYVHRGEPALILRVRDRDDVAAALEFARTRQMPLSVRSGGHGISGRSTNDGGIVIDLSAINRTTVMTRQARRVRIEAGARWGDVARHLAPRGLALSSGDSGDVGVGGLATSGGIGWFARLHGLTIDRVRAVDMVLADGSFVRADAETHPDLFWAVRGAGANLGVVTAFEFEASEVGRLAFGVITYDASDASALLTRWGAAVEAAPREITSFLTLVPTRTGPVAQARTVYAGSSLDAAREALNPLLKAGPVLSQQIHHLAYPHLVCSSGRPNQGRQDLGEARSGLLEHITSPIAREVGSALAAGRIPLVQFRSIGGAVNDAAPDATAYAHRTQNFSVMAASHPRHHTALDWHWERLYPHLHGLYLSFETRTGDQQLRDAFPEATLRRLRLIKATYDPEHVFNRNFPISTPSSSPTRVG
ncbi:LLM class flavin-dependent oxidoreductase [Streptomyces sp. NPDC085932]|uniref:LLM class flavin-dependent oxidoreductase n=1 Tax=Streptomyces sp. NPDC085932 TaxID=3365741 RepID=UPI0037CE104B